MVQCCHDVDRRSQNCTNDNTQNTNVGSEPDPEELERPPMSLLIRDSINTVPFNGPSLKRAIPSRDEVLQFRTFPRIL
jgi:hypothetical protein